MTAVIDLDSRRSPANATTNSLDGSRWYTHPRTQERFLSVTTGLDIMAKNGLLPWATGLSADVAFAELPRLVNATITPACGRTSNRCDNHDWRQRCDQCPCDRCQPCVRRWIANQHYAESRRGRDRGSAVHDVIEWWALHEDWCTYNPEIEPWVTSFRTFVAEMQPDPFLSETTVINREQSYAGTLDLGLLITGDKSKQAAEFCSRFGLPTVRVLADTKTTKKRENNFYREWALQVGGGYRHAEAIMLPDGSEEPMPTVDGAAILLLRPDGYAFRPVVSNDKTYFAFLCALNLYRWAVEDGDKATQVKSFPLPVVQSPVKPTTAPTAAAAEAKPTKKTTAARKTAPQRPLAERVLGRPDPHPNSPYGDEIPF